MGELQIDTDVLVIGGGSAGCWAAIRAKEIAPRVTLIDKANVSRSGASSSVYYLLAPPPKDDLALWKQEIVERGTYLNNQEWVDILLAEHPQRLKQMEAWGVPFERDETGNLVQKAGRGQLITRFIMSDGRARMGIIKQKAADLGVNFVEKVMLTDLLTSDGQHPTEGSVVGAVGFDTWTGEFVVIKSKATVIASGPIHLHYNISGDGQAAAFRCGAEMMCMEFCNPPIPLLTDGKRDFGDLNVLFQSLDFRLLNSRGERFMEKYSPIMKEKSDWALICQALAKENLEGRGPVILDMSQVKQEDIDYFGKLHYGRMAPFIEAGIDLKRDRILCVAQARLASSSGDGGIRIDKDGRTNLSGLFAAGSACKNLLHGTYSVSVLSQTFCSTFGYRAGETAARESQGIKPQAPKTHQVEALRKQIYSSTRRDNGLSPSDVIDRLKDIITPVEVSIIKSSGRIEKAISALTTMEADELPRMRSRDTHELAKAIGATNYALLAKLTLASATERKESRYNHYREEYPYRDDKDWLKWTIIKRKGEQGLDLKTEDVPIDKYPVKPAKRDRIPHPVQFA